MFCKNYINITQINHYTIGTELLQCCCYTCRSKISFLLVHRNKLNFAVTGQWSGLPDQHNNHSVIHHPHHRRVAQIQPFQKQSLVNHLWKWWTQSHILLRAPSYFGTTNAWYSSVPLLGWGKNVLERERRQGRRALNIRIIVEVHKRESLAEASRTSGPTFLSRLNMEIGLALL